MDTELFSASRCHVFRLPAENPLKSEDWEGRHIWTGAVKVAVVNASVEVRLVDSETGAVFGTCPVSEDPDAPKSVQQAVDSSRCFVLRVVNGAQHAYVGINFQERSDAFSFNVALTERKKHLQPVQGLSTPAHLENMALKSGEVLHVDIAGKVKTSATALPVAPPLHGPNVKLTQPPPTGGVNRRRITQQDFESQAGPSPTPVAPGAVQQVAVQSAPQQHYATHLPTAVRHESSTTSSARQSSSLDDLFS
jgi:adaptin ear-binding coat-associated protein 1/2